MFEKVLFPTDFSERANIMLDCVASFPQVREVILLHVVKEIQYPMGADIVDTWKTEAAKKTLAEAEDYLRLLNPAIRVTIRTTVSSDITEGILATAEKSGAGLIVVSAHEKGLKTGVLLGSVPATLLCRISRTSVLFMRHRIVEHLTGTTYEKFCPMLFSRVLCPTDFSTFSEQATALAGSIKGVGEVILLHVVPVPGTAGETAASVRAAEARLGEACDRLAAQGISCRKFVTSGDPADGIARAAEDLDASVIFISSLGKGCLHDLLVGSTVQDVAMKSARPVIVVRPER